MRKRFDSKIVVGLSGDHSLANVGILFNRNDNYLLMYCATVTCAADTRAQAIDLVPYLSYLGTASITWQHPLIVLKLGALPMPQGGRWKFDHVMHKLETNETPGELAHIKDNIRRIVLGLILTELKR